MVNQFDVIAERRGLKAPEGRVPRSPVHDAIIDILTKFADNTTRYYNLDLITASPRIEGQDDPVAEWWKRVVIPIVSDIPERQRNRVMDNAHLVEEMLDGVALVRHTSETGEAINDSFSASERTGITDLTKPHQRLHVLQIARSIQEVIWCLQNEAHRSQLKDIPYLSEFFAIYNNDDKYFKGRKTWSIYGG